MVHIFLNHLVWICIYELIRANEIVHPQSRHDFIDQFHLRVSSYIYTFSSCVRVNMI